LTNSYQWEHFANHRGLTGSLSSGEFEMLMRFLKDESGASAAEYALILAIVGTAIAAAAIFLGDEIAGAMNDAADCIDKGTTTACA